MDLKDRLLLFIEYKGVDKAHFEREAGLSNGFVDKSGDNTRTSSLNKIAEVYPDLNINWLRTGDGDMLNSNLTVTSLSKGVSNLGTIQGSIITGSNNKTDIANSLEITLLKEENKRLQSILDEKERLLDEKERLIQILIKNN